MLYITFISFCLLVFFLFLFKKLRNATIVVLVVFGLILLLPMVSNKFKFNIISGGEHLLSVSSSKEEAIKRGVYVCDVRLPYSPYKVNDTLKLSIKSGWIEKSWRSGYWYWTTIENNVGYSIRIVSDLSESSNHDWIVRNNRSSRFGREGLGFHNGNFGGSLDKLPESDTLHYNVLRKDTMDFSEQNILGQLMIILDRN